MVLNKPRKRLPGVYEKEKEPREEACKPRKHVVNLDDNITEDDLDVGDYNCEELSPFPDLSF